MRKRELMEFIHAADIHLDSLLSGRAVCAQGKSFVHCAVAIDLVEFIS